ncbi:hypothetical protein CHU98_g3587 [Xylaria longipes]|nr:hypothetical protein CHU98_g3587 [Xylaria longipes]
MMLIGNLIYVLVLLTNALAILSEDRFLSRINFSSASYDPAFGTGHDTQSIRAKAINLIASVRTLMRSTCRAVSCHSTQTFHSSPFTYSRRPTPSAKMKSRMKEKTSRTSNTLTKKTI